MKFFTRYNYEEPVKEVNSGLRIVETDSYVPIARQIQAMELAGINLANANAGLKYDFEDCDYETGLPKEGFVDDPTRDPNFDDIDAQNIVRGLKPTFVPSAEKVLSAEKFVEKTPEEKGQEAHD